MLSEETKKEMKVDWRLEELLAALARYNKAAEKVGRPHMKLGETDGTED